MDGGGNAEVEGMRVGITSKRVSAIRQIRVGNGKKRARKTHRTRGWEHRKVEGKM